MALDHDQQLVEAFRSGRDEASFRVLYRACTPRLYGMATRLLGSKQGADDMVQETWIRAVERIDDFAGRSAFSTWLTGVLINCFRETVRRNMNFEDRDDMDKVVVFSTRQDGHASIDVERALAELPGGFREVVVLHDIYGYTHEEIGKLLGVASGTSKSQLARGRARLHQLLAEPTGKRENRHE